MKNKIILLLVTTVVSGFLFTSEGFALSKKERADNCFQAGYEAYTNGDYTKSIRNCRRCVAKDKNNFDCYLLLAKSYWEKKDFRHTVKYLNKAARIKPNDYRVWFSLGTVYKEKNKIDQAIEFYEKSLPYNSAYAQTYLDLGECYSRKQDYPQVIYYVTRGLTRGADNAQARFFLGAAYNKINDVVSALEHYNILRSMDTILAEKLLAEIKDRELPVPR